MEPVRTKFILEKVFTHLMDLTCLEKPNSDDEKRVSKRILEMLEDLCSIDDTKKLDISLHSDTVLSEYLNNLAKETFKSGCNVYRILTYILAVTRIVLVNKLCPIVTYDALEKIIDEQVQPWIDSKKVGLIAWMVNCNRWREREKKK